MLVMTHILLLRVVLVLSEYGTRTRQRVRPPHTLANSRSGLRGLMLGGYDLIAACAEQRFHNLQVDVL